MRQLKKHPSETFMVKLVESDHGQTPPPKIGYLLFGIPTIVFTSADDLNELYVTKNSAYSKHPIKRAGSAPLFNKSMALMDTDDPDYKAKRKALSAAFLKSKMSQIIEITKESAFVSFAELQQKGAESEIELVSTVSKV